MVTPLDALKAKYMKDPDIIPPEGQNKEELAEALAQQQIRQRKNNDRAFELLTKAGSNEVDSGSSGGAKEGGDSAMYRLTEFVQKPVEKTELERKMWGEPTKKHLKIMNRPLSVLKKEDIADIKLDAPPAPDSDEQKTEIKQIKDLRSLLDKEAVRERVEKQDEDLLFPFNRYLRENNLEIDREKFMAILKDVNTIIFKFKYFFNRPRPHQHSDLEEIENVGGKSPAYPSGHSTTGAVIAELLAEQFPEHAENLRVMGTELGYNRIIAGLHHPSDHLAGLALASQLIPLLVDVKITKSDQFMNELFKYMAHRENLLKDMTQIGTQDILDGVRIDKESNPRVPRKKGQPAKSKKHSDLYTDEDPKGTIQGLGFKDVKTAKASVSKIKKSGRKHAHKIQAAVAMEQRAKAAGKSSEAAVYRKYIDSMKEKTKRLEKHSEEDHTVEHIAEEKPFNMDDAKQSLENQLEQIQNKLNTGDYQIEKFLTKAVDNFDSKKEIKEYKSIQTYLKNNIKEDAMGTLEEFKRELDDYINGFEYQELSPNRKEAVLRAIRNNIEEEGLSFDPAAKFRDIARVAQRGPDALSALVNSASDRVDAKTVANQLNEEKPKSKYDENNLMYYVRSNVKRELEEKQNTDKAKHPLQDQFNKLPAEAKKAFKDNFSPDSLATFGMVEWLKNWKPKQTRSERSVINQSEQKQHKEMYDQLSEDPNNLVSYLTFPSIANEIEKQKKDLIDNGVLDRQTFKYTDTDQDYVYMHPLQPLVNALTEEDKKEFIDKISQRKAKFKYVGLQKYISDEFVSNKYALIDPNLTGAYNPDLDPPKVGGDTINKYIRNSQHIAVNNPLNKPPEVLKDPRKNEAVVIKNKPFEYDTSSPEEAKKRFEELNVDEDPYEDVNVSPEEAKNNWDDAFNVEIDKNNLNDDQIEKIENSEINFVDIGNRFKITDAHLLDEKRIQDEINNLNTGVDPSEKITAFINNGFDNVEVKTNGDGNEINVGLEDFKNQISKASQKIQEELQNNDDRELVKIADITNLAVDLKDRSNRADLSPEEIETYENDKGKLAELIADYFLEHDQLKLFEALETSEVVTNFDALNSIATGDLNTINNAFPPIEADEPTNEETQEIVEDNQEEESSNAEENESEVPEGSFTSETFANVPADRFTFGGGFIENSGLRHAFLGVKGAGDTMWGQWYAETKVINPDTKKTEFEWRPNDGFYLIKRSQDQIDKLKKKFPDRGEPSPVKQMHSNRRYHLDFTADGMDEGFQFYYDRYNNGEVMDFESLMTAIENEESRKIREEFKELQRQDARKKFDSKNYEYNDAFHGTAIDILKDADGIFADDLATLEKPFKKQGYTFNQNQALEAETFNDKYDEIAQKLVPEWRVDDEVRKSQSTPIDEDDLNNQIYVRKLRNELSLDKSNLNNPIDVFIASDLHFMNHPEASNFLTGTSTKLKVNTDGDIEIDANEAEKNNINTGDPVKEDIAEEAPVKEDAVEEDAVEETQAEDLDAVLNTHSEIVNNLYRMKHTPSVYSLDKFKNELKTKHKTVDELEKHLSEQISGSNKQKYDKFVASQQEEQSATGAEKPPVKTPPTAEETPSDQPAAPVASARQIAREITNQVNEMPTLFNRRQDGTVAANQIANNQSMMNRYRVLRSMFAVQGAHISEGGKSEFVDENGQPITRGQIEEEIKSIDPEVISKVQKDLQGINTHLPRSLQAKLVKEESRPDYFEESHLKDLQESRTNSAQQEQVHNQRMGEIKKEGINHERFNSDLHKETQQLKEWTPALQENFMAEMNEKYAGQEGGPTKSQLEKERIERGLPPGDPKPRMVKDAKTGAVVQQGFYLWHAGTHSWVTPEYVKVHGEAAAGLPTGSAVDLTQLKDSVNLPAHILEGTTAQKQGLVGMLHDGEKGASFDGKVSNLSMIPAMGTRDENNNITHTDNIHQFTNDAHAAHMNVMGHYAEQQVKGSIENKSTLTDTSRGVRAYQAAGTSALNRYSARFKAAGGFKGALARFASEVGSFAPGRSSSPEVSAKFSSPSFEEE